MMTTRKREGTRDYKKNREAKGSEEYDYTAYYGEEIFLRSSLFESEKQQLESRISNRESKNRSIKWKNTALVISITTLLIATLTMMTMTTIHQLNIDQLKTDLQNVNQSQLISRKATFLESIPLRDWKVC